MDYAQATPYTKDNCILIIPDIALDYRMHILLVRELEKSFPGRLVIIADPVREAQ